MNKGRYLSFEEGVSMEKTVIAGHGEAIQFPVFLLVSRRPSVLTQKDYSF